MFIFAILFSYINQCCPPVKTKNFSNININLPIKNLTPKKIIFFKKAGDLNMGQRRTEFANNLGAVYKFHSHIAELAKPNSVGLTSYFKTNWE